MAVTTDKMDRAPNRRDIDPRRESIYDGWDSMPRTESVFDYLHSNAEPDGHASPKSSPKNSPKSKHAPIAISNRFALLEDEPVSE